ncbi:5-formyltetrahydrofolate cyclo-ligase [Aerophototrophica crusticola]|uniref:5-formyltetrahydrofolate cyclo-ligase n=1 Tax=Aerophototrophica crusticola TaxID=1709002 RepID=A0A858R8K4_9PROT|nr:5-formyltetrahydrofolate cyclo-ligase [Rhodospirillaceae bacterium B3]
MASSQTLSPQSDADAVAEAKRAARAAARAVRSGIDPNGAGEAVAKLVLESFADRLAPELIVSAYWPRGDELDTRPILRALAARGIRTCLPVVAGRGWPLLFKLWRDGHPLVPGGFGVMEPMAEAPVVRPDLLLVPLLAWDRQGYRLGYGAGYYDRTLEALRLEGPPVVAAGIGYAAQELPAVPRDGYDQRLDWIVTEQAAVRISKD